MGQAMGLGLSEVLVGGRRAAGRDREGGSSIFQQLHQPWVAEGLVLDSGDILWQEHRSLALCCWQWASLLG